MRMSTDLALNLSLIGGSDVVPVHEVNRTHQERHDIANFPTARTFHWRIAL